MSTNKWIIYPFWGVCKLLDCYSEGRGFPPWFLFLGFFNLLSFLVMRAVTWFQELPTYTFLTKILMRRIPLILFLKDVTFCNFEFYPLVFLSLSAEYRVRGQKNPTMCIFFRSKNLWFCVYAHQYFSVLMVWRCPDLLLFNKKVCITETGGEEGSKMRGKSRKVSADRLKMRCLRRRVNEIRGTD